MCHAKCEAAPGGGWGAACTPGGATLHAPPARPPAADAACLAATRQSLRACLARCSNKIQCGVMSPADIVNTAEFHVFERALYKVGGALLPVPALLPKLWEVQRPPGPSARLDPCAPLYLAHSSFFARFQLMSLVQRFCPHLTAPQGYYGGEGAQLGSIYKSVSLLAPIRGNGRRLRQL